MDEKQIDLNLNEIKRFQQAINQLGDDMLIHRIELLSKQLVFIGRLASAFSEEYKRTIATRKRTHAEAYLNAEKYKAAQAELAVADIREQEAEAYGNYKRWTNAFESTKEEIHALKYKLRVGIEDGSNNQGV